MDHPRSVLPSLLTVGETAEELRYHRSTTYQLIKKGTIPSIRLWRTIRVRRADLEALLEASRYWTRDQVLS